MYWISYLVGIVSFTALTHKDISSGTRLMMMTSNNMRNTMARRIVMIFPQHVGRKDTPLFYYCESVAILQHHQRMEFTFHNSYAILELLSSDCLDRTQLLT